MSDADTTLLPVGINKEDLELQVEVLQAGEFHFDHMPRSETWRAAKALVDAGLVNYWESGSDEAQYTAMNFRITDEGRAALRSVSARYMKNLSMASESQPDTLATERA